MDKAAFLCIHRDSAVVSDMFMASGSHVEERCLAAVGIAHQSDSDDLPALFRQRSHLPFQPCLILGVQRRQRFPCGKHLLRLTFADDLDLGRLGPAQRYLVSDYLIFDRVPQRSIKDHLDLIAPHETHFYYPLAESSMAVDLDDDSTFSCLKFR